MQVENAAEVQHDPDSGTNNVPRARGEWAAKRDEDRVDKVHQSGTMRSELGHQWQRLPGRNSREDRSGRWAGQEEGMAP